MKRSTKFAVGILVAIGVLAIALLVLNNYLESRIKTAIENNLKRSQATYEKVDVKLLSRKAEVINPYFKIKGKTLKVDTILLNDIHLWDYINNKDIIIGELSISNPVVKIYKDQKKPEDSSASKSSSKFKNKLLIKRLQLNKGSFQIFENDSSLNKLYAGIKSLKMEQVRVNSKTLKETVPFDYDLIRLEADSLYYDLSKQQSLSIANLLVVNNSVDLTGFKLAPKNSKAGHQKTISKEKDWYDLSIDTVSMDNFSWSAERDSLKFQNSFTDINGVRLEIYRDKLQPDDTSYKPLYSKMIRELPILLSIDSMAIRNAYIRYEEKIKADRESGMVEFSALNARISNITNIDLDRKDFPQTVININARFMKEAPLEVNWQFDISNTSDYFSISGQMGNLGAEQMNRFMKPAMNVEAKGEILDMYFNFAGNDREASGDMKLEYKDFKVEVLRKDGQKKNKIVSALANLIVKNKALNEKANYKEISYTRDATKSFWNYFWNLIKNGALKAFL